MFYAAVNVSLLLRSYMMWLLAVVGISMFSNSVNLWHSFYTDGWLDFYGHSRESMWDERCGQLDQTNPAPKGGLGDLHSNHKWCQTWAVAQVFYLLLYSLFTFNPENLKFEEKFHLSAQMTEQVMTHAKKKKNQFRQRNKLDSDTQWQMSPYF